MIDLKEFRESAEHVKNTYATPYDFNVLEVVDRAIAAEAKLAEIEKQEPASWQYQDHDGNWQSFANEKHRIDTTESGEWNVRPLYASPVQESQTSMKHWWVDKVQQSPASDQHITIEGYDEKALHRKSVESLVQQSPAVAFPNTVNIELIIDSLKIYKLSLHPDKLKALRDLVQVQIDLLSTAAQSAEQKETIANRFKSRKLPDNPISEIMEPNDIVIEQPDSAAPKQRITEQDAREFFGCVIGFVNSYPHWDCDFWFENFGRTILAKLNENREPM